MADGGEQAIACTARRGRKRQLLHRLAAIVAAQQAVDHLIHETVARDGADGVIIADWERRHLLARVAGVRRLDHLERQAGRVDERVQLLPARRRDAATAKRVDEHEDFLGRIGGWTKRLINGGGRGLCLLECGARDLLFSVLACVFAGLLSRVGIEDEPRRSVERVCG